MLFSAVATWACSCIITGDTHAALEGSKNVVVVKLLSLNRSGEGDAGLDGIRRIKFVVDKVYKGDLTPGGGLTASQDNGAGCTWAWNYSDEIIGTRYLLFLGPDDEYQGVWNIFSCGGSTSVESGRDTLYYLDNLATLGDKTRVYGSLSWWGSAYVGSMAGKTVRIKGNGRTINLKTDKTGKFEIYGLSPGKYKIMPTKIKGYKFTDKSKDEDRVIDLKPAAHAMVDFYFRKKRKKK